MLSISIWFNLTFCIEYFNIFIPPPSSIDIIVLFLYTVFIELHLSLRASVCVSVCGSRVSALAPSFDVDASPRGRCCWCWRWLADDSALPSTLRISTMSRLTPPITLCVSVWVNCLKCNCKEDAIKQLDTRALKRRHPGRGSPPPTIFLFIFCCSLPHLLFSLCCIFTAALQFVFI